MKKTQKIMTALAAGTIGAVVLALAGAGLQVAQAQVSSEGGPVMIGGDAMRMDEASHTQTLTGRVEVIQDDARLRADKVVITRQAGPNGSGFGEIVTIEATGNVYYITAESTMKGDLAVYTKATDAMVLTGDVILTQKQNVTTGTRLVYDVGKKTTTFDAPKNGGMGRVKAIIYPDKKDAPAPAQ